MEKKKRKKKHRKHRDFVQPTQKMTTNQTIPLFPKDQPPQNY
jgi:hypothetical protein